MNNECITDTDRLFDEVIEDPDGNDRAVGHNAERNEALFAKVKAEMVKRIFGNAPAKARNEAATPPTDQLTN